MRPKNYKPCGRMRTLSLSSLHNVNISSLFTKSSSFSWKSVVFVVFLNALFFRGVHACVITSLYFNRFFANHYSHIVKNCVVSNMEEISQECGEQPVFPVYNSDV